MLKHVLNLKCWITRIIYEKNAKTKDIETKSMQANKRERGKGGEEKRGSKKAKYVTTTQHMKSKWKLGILLNEQAEKNRTI